MLFSPVNVKKIPGIITLVTYGVRHHVIPRLKPGGRKTLRDGLEAQGTFLLFHQENSFTEKNKKFF
jgi:hypothetical protein